MKKPIFRIRGKDEAGFTLLELTIVIIIVSLMLSAGAAALMRYLQDARERTAVMRIEEIETALGRFLALNGRYPCPARLNVAPDTANFGIEAVANCTTTNAGGTFRAAGTGGRQVRIGAVPVRALNLPDEYIADPWSMRILYVVTEQLALASTFSQSLGAISIVDTVGNSVITPAGSAHYAVISVGPDNRGTYTTQGVSGPSCVTTALDGENCNHDATLRATLLYSSTRDNNNFDDYIGYVGARALDSGVPSGAVMPFNLNACPNGWAPYANAVGRAVVGTGTLTQNYNPGNRAPWNETRTYALGDTGGFMSWRLNVNEMPRHNHAVPMIGNVFPALSGVLGLVPSPMGVFTNTAVVNAGKTTFDAGLDTPHENMPPYVALLYCQKL